MIISPNYLPQPQPPGSHEQAKEQRISASARKRKGRRLLAAGSGLGGSLSQSSLMLKDKQRQDVQKNHGQTQSPYPKTQPGSSVLHTFVEPATGNHHKKKYYCAQQKCGEKNERPEFRSPSKGRSKGEKSDRSDQTHYRKCKKQ
jgi:hypothetical protein